MSNYFSCTRPEHDRGPGSSHSQLTTGWCGEEYDAEADNMHAMAKRGLTFFILANVALLTIALFRMFYLSRLDVNQVSVNFLYDIGIKRHYFVFAVFISVSFLLAWLFPGLFTPQKKYCKASYHRLLRQLMAANFIMTLAWLVVFALYHHKVFLPLNQFESIESGLWLLIPLAYVGGILVIPRFSLFMLCSLIIQQLLSLDFQSGRIGVVLMIFSCLLMFIAVLFYAVCHAMRLFRLSNQNS